jgi:hypothetical protein
MNRMLPIAIINSNELMRRSTNGARADDPVVPERPRRAWRRVRPAQPPSAARGACAAPVLKPRGTS